jgi:hypothetical protein
LQLRGEALAQDSAFVDYVAQSLIPNPQLGGAVDSVSISDLLRERRKGYDIAMVLDYRGTPVASSGILLKDPVSIRKDPLVTAAISQLKPRQGVWLDHGQLLWVAVNPLLRSGALQGVLVTATRVDAAFAVAIGHIARADVALVATAATAWRHRQQWPGSVAVGRTAERDELGHAAEGLRRSRGAGGDRVGQGLRRG